ncbi:hypothetical protein TNIN_248341 [Trichonephila inaurata madagascariensis]|uniref:Uncharacterized protein n=1 Tax=Trichonephila inaurata madagascariensis TaxID=2747483 RepID=A0A8X6YDH7_9ARAC|nr:hypothetical protein TNIN_248341 [Trichonephila inaurata madagascariensis]
MCFPRGLPFLSKLAFVNQEKILLKATERVAQENSNAASSEINGSNSFTKCGISIDGTWQRRDYSSLNGCVSELKQSADLTDSQNEAYNNRFQILNSTHQITLRRGC